MTVLASILKDGDDVDMPALRAWLATVHAQASEAALALTTATLGEMVGDRVYETAAQLPAEPAAGVYALVTFDPDEEKIGLWKKAGAAGLPGWEGPSQALRGPGLTTAEQARLAAIEGRFPDIQSFWRGRKIVVLGDSIPAGDGAANSYPYLVGQSLGATLVNEARTGAAAQNGNARIRTGADPYGWTGQHWLYVSHSLSGTISEKNELISNWEVKWRDLMIGDAKPTTLSAPMQTEILASSWENRLSPHLGAGNRADLYLFSLGFNNIGEILSEGKVSDQDRGTYIGAMSYLIGKIQNDNPKARIALIGHYENQLRPWLAKAQEMVAAKLGLPLLRLWEQLGWSQFKPDGATPMLNRVLTVNGYHPHDQPDGWANEQIARFVTDWLRDGLPVAGSDTSSLINDTPSDVLALSKPAPGTPQMGVIFHDADRDLSADNALYMPDNMRIFNVTRGHDVLGIVASHPSFEMRTHRKIVLPDDGQAWVLYSRSDTGDLGLALYSDYPAIERSNRNLVTPLLTSWGSVAGRLPVMRLRDAYAANALAGGAAMDGADILTNPDAGSARVRITDPYLLGKGFFQGWQSAINGRAAAGGRFPIGRKLGGRLWTVRWSVQVSADNGWGAHPPIYLWDGDKLHSVEIPGDSILVEQQISARLRVYRATVYLPDLSMTHFFVSHEMAGTGARATITGLQSGFGLDIRRDDYPAPPAPNLYIGGRTMDGVNTAAYDTTGSDAGSALAPVVAPELLGRGLTQGWRCAINGRASRGAFFPADKPVSDLPWTFEWFQETTVDNQWGLNPVVYFWDGSTYLENYSIEGAFVTEPLSARVRRIRFTNRIPAGITPTHFYVSHDMAGTGARATIAGLQFGQGLAIAPDDYPTASAVDPVIAARDAANLQRAAQMRSRTVTWLQTPQAAYNILILDGQSLASGQETWPSLSVTQYGGNLTLGGAPFPAAYSGNTYPTFGPATLEPLVARTVNAAHDTLLNDAAVAALPPGDAAFGEPPNITWANDAKYRLNQMLLTEDDASRKFVTINGAVSGQGIARYLKPSGEWYGRTKDGLAKVKAAAGASTCAVSGLLWMQGEYDYLQLEGGVNRKLTYKAALNKLFDDYHTDFVAITGQVRPFAKLLYQTGASYTVDDDTDGNPAIAIGMAQIEVSLERNDAFLVGPTYPVTDKGGHLDSNGSRWFGAQAAKVHHRVIHEGHDWEPVRPIRVAQVGRVVHVDFHVPYPPLVFDAPYVINAATEIADKGFKVTDASGTVPIDSVALVGQTIVAIVLGRATIGTVRVWYAHQSVGGAGMLRDSDPSQSRENYTYTAGSGQYPSANIAALVGKPYPLWNWSVAFMYPIVFSGQA